MKFDISDGWKCLEDKNLRNCLNFPLKKLILETAKISFSLNMSISQRKLQLQFINEMRSAQLFI